VERSFLTTPPSSTPTAPIAGARLAEAVRERGGATRIAPTSWCGREGDAAAAEAFAAEVKEIRRVRSRIEKIFGTW
jgi:hypothetical protein